MTPRWVKGLGLVVALSVLWLVFSAYTHPPFMMTLATQVWACF